MKVAIVGLGRMGRRHVEVVQKLGMDVVGLVDRDPKAAADAAEEFRLSGDCLFDDVGAMLAATRPEAFVVATTAPTHADLVTAAAEAGVRYILCEKPIAVSISQTDEIRKACANAGAVLAVNHQMRFMPHYVETKALIDSPELGGLSSILVAAGNFGLAMNGSHYFEMFRFMTGAPAKSIQAWFDEARLPNPRGPEFEDRSGQVRVTSQTGHTMFMDLSAQAGHGIQVVYICRHGQVVVDELSGKVKVMHRKAEFRALPSTRYGMPEEARDFEVSPAELIESTSAVWRAMFAGGGYPDIDVGANTVRCLVAAHVSNERNNAPIELDDAALDADRIFPWA